MTGFYPVDKPLNLPKANKSTSPWNEFQFTFIKYLSPLYFFSLVFIKSFFFFLMSFLNSCCGFFSPIQGLHPKGFALSCSPCRPSQHTVYIRVNLLYGVSLFSVRGSSPFFSRKFKLIRKSPIRNLCWRQILTH